MNLPERLHHLRHSAAEDPDVPERVRAFLLTGAPLEEIRLDTRGRWHHEGEPFRNARLARLFHRSLQRTPAGTWVLHVAPYTYPVLVDGVGRFITQLVLDDPLQATLACGRTVPLPRDSLITDGDRFVGALLPGGDPARCVDRAWHVVMDALDTDADGWLLRAPSGAIRLHGVPSDG